MQMLESNFVECSTYSSACRAQEDLALCLGGRAEKVDPASGGPREPDVTAQPVPLPQPT